MTVPVRLGVVLAAVTAALTTAAWATVQTSSPVGRWKTVDDNTGEVRSIVEITTVDGELQGTVRQIMPAPGEDPNPICTECKDEFKDKPVIGMRIMWGLKADDDEFTGGHIMDPDNGKTYKCKIKLVDGGQKLEVRGFIGFSLFGRTQTWIRE